MPRVAFAASKLLCTETPFTCETALSDEVQQPETTEADTAAAESEAQAADQVDGDIGSESPAPAKQEELADQDAVTEEVAVEEVVAEEAVPEEAVVDSYTEEASEDTASEAEESEVAEVAELEDDGLAAAEAAMDDEEEPAVVASSGPIEELDDGDEDIELNWYILKVQSNRERTSSNALKRKIAIEGIENLFGEIIVPTEKVTEFKNGKKKVVERKIWPGYIAVQMHVNDDTWFAIRETAGIGDFTGASGKPIPMQPHEIAMILHKEEEEGTEDAPKLNIKFSEGEKVKVKDGNFENFEGEVHAIDQQSGKVTIMISIFGRSTPVELEYWQVETL